MKTPTVSTALLSLAVLTPSLAQAPFTKVTEGPIPNEGTWAENCSWGDLDGDGRIDLFVARSGGLGGADLMYQNLGQGEFAKVTNAVTLAGVGRSSGSAWVDYDNNGTLDLAVGGCLGAFDHVYRNDGGGNFSPVSSESFPRDTDETQALAWADYDLDGNVDLFISNQGARSAFHRNNGNGTFTRITSGIEPDATQAVGCSWCDYDGDRFPDLFVACREPDLDRLYHNNGDGSFEPVASVSDYGWGGPSWGDYDNDGWPDLLVTRLDFANSLYHNDGNGTFTQVSNSVATNRAIWSVAGMWGDYDNDGFLDLVVVNWDVASRTFLYHNNGNTNRWLMVRLVGTASNQAAIGAKVRVQAPIWGKSFWQLREISGGGGFGSQNDLRAHFGLGDATNVTTLRIEWPSGIVQELTNVAANQILTIAEPAQLVPLGPRDFQIRCWKGMRFEVEKSLNLQAWNSLGMVTNVTGTLTFQDTQGDPQAACRFYRVVSR